MKGFTLIELLITVAILTAVAVIGGINLFGYYSRQNLELTINEITALIRDAQGEGWGVHFENAVSQDSVKLFCCGASYASSTLVSVYVLRANTQFTNPAEPNFQDIIFSKLTGYPNASTSISIALKGNPSASSTITVSAIGRVTKTGL